ncbi:hypothetical protein BB558_000163 [Smittium angustum]|uniref:GAT domain-containing protein n=1 Tax=Smittium angustum TaxID=133377 RepID=A0A2U1JEU9_SMIAN|nr:hypothetical protein BB558_000163 [Smittium angustum]
MNMIKKKSKIESTLSNVKNDPTQIGTIYYIVNNDFQKAEEAVNVLKRKIFGLENGVFKPKKSKVSTEQTYLMIWEYLLEYSEFVKKATLSEQGLQDIEDIFKNDEIKFYLKKPFLSMIGTWVYLFETELRIRSSLENVIFDAKNRYGMIPKYKMKPEVEQALSIMMVNEKNQTGEGYTIDRAPHFGNQPLNQNNASGSAYFPNNMFMPNKFMTNNNTLSEAYLSQAVADSEKSISMCQMMDEILFTLDSLDNLENNEAINDLVSQIKIEKNKIMEYMGLIDGSHEPVLGKLLKANDMIIDTLDKYNGAVEEFFMEKAKANSLTNSNSPENSQEMSRSPMFNSFGMNDDLMVFDDQYHNSNEAGPSRSPNRSKSPFLEFRQQSTHDNSHFQLPPNKETTNYLNAVNSDQHGAVQHRNDGGESTEYPTANPNQSFNNNDETSKNNN